MVNCMTLQVRENQCFVRGQPRLARILSDRGHIVKRSPSTLRCPQHAGYNGGVFFSPQIQRYLDARDSKFFFGSTERWKTDR